MDGGAADAALADAGSAADAGPARVDARPDGSVRDTGRDTGVPSCPENDLGTMVGRPVATGTTAGASTSAVAGCASGESSPARRYRWQAPSTGTFVIDTFGSSFDTALVILEGACAGLEVDCNDDEGTGSQSRVSLTAASGDVFVIVVLGYDGTESGAFSLSISEPSAASEVGLCSNGLDDDLDGYADCDDDDCWTEAACIETDCTNGLDDDGDGDTDCLDFDCDGLPACVEGDCMNGLDDDGDSAIDCADFDCDGIAPCIETLCADGLDDEGDGATDCDDYDCRTDVACIERLCANALDDESDGLTDCQDDDCDADAACAGMEHCFNGDDDDLDGLFDCDDPECTAHPYCLILP